MEEEENSNIFAGNRSDISEEMTTTTESDEARRNVIKRYEEKRVMGSCSEYRNIGRVTRVANDVSKRMSKYQHIAVTKKKKKKRM